MSKAKSSAKASSANPAEKRRARRRPVLDTFSLFAVVPDKAPLRLPIHDVSELGIGFGLDVEGEDQSLFPVKQGEQLEIRLYLNQSMYLPLAAKVARVVDSNGVRKIGAEFVAKSSKGYKGLVAFIEMLDEIVEAVRLDPSA